MYFSTVRMFVYAPGSFADTWCLYVRAFNAMRADFRAEDTGFRLSLQHR